MRGSMASQFCRCFEMSALFQNEDVMITTLHCILKAMRLCRGTGPGRRADTKREIVCVPDLQGNIPICCTVLHQYLPLAITYLAEGTIWGLLNSVCHMRADFDSVFVCVCVCACVCVCVCVCACVDLHCQRCLENKREGRKLNL